MTDFNTVVEWLYTFEESHLSSEAKQMMDYIMADCGLPTWVSPPEWPTSTKPKDIPEAIKMFVDDCIRRKSLIFDREYPEAMVLLSRYYFNKGNLWDEAVETLEIAKTEYTNMLPKQPLPGSTSPFNPKYLLAVVSWLLGLALNKTLDTATGYESMKKAIDDFGEIAKFSGRDHPPSHGVFCGEKLVEMRKVIFCMPEKAYSWLDEGSLKWSVEYGGGNHLNEPTIQLKKILIQRFKNNDYRGVYSELEKFHKISKESVHSLKRNMIYGEADALLVSAMLLFWMGNTIEARDTLKKAVEIYLPDTHCEGVSYWMLGVMYLFPPVEKTKVVDYCQDAIKCFKRNHFVANRRHDKVAYDWYEDKICLMNQTMELIIQKRIF